MIDNPPVLNEIIGGDALGLGAAARLLPAHRGEGRASPSTVWRWITTGTRTADGRTVRLEASRVGGRWLTSRGAMTRYMTALTSPASTDNDSKQERTRSDSQRQRASIAAANKLDGFLGVSDVGVS